MSTTIPNVSSIYRDLSHISSNLSKQQYQSQYGGLPTYKSPYSLQADRNTNTNMGMGMRNRNQQKTCFQDLYAYKEKRHRQLMGKLKNSCQEYKMIVGAKDNGNRQYDSFSHREAYQPQQYQSQPYQYANQFQNRSADIKINNFVMPKIRYRHIQDNKQKNQSSTIMNRQPRTTVSPLKQQIQSQKLQRQFYQDIPKQSQIPVAGIGIQTKTGQNFAIPEYDDNKSQISHNTVNRTNKNIKYQEKIQSYYELCRKKLDNGNNGMGNYKNKDGKQSKEDKFIRDGKGKSKVMKLDQAIKLLSLD